MIYQVTVKPDSKKGPLVVEQDAELVVYLREKPVAGAANTALIKILADHLQVPKTCVKIKTGARGRKKLVQVD